MSFVKYSASALLAMGLASTLNAATLQEALSNGKVDGMIRYMMVNGSDTSVDAARGSDNKHEAAVGLLLNYTSADFYGFNLGTSFQVSHDLQIDDEGENEGRLGFSDSQLSQAYLQYNFNKSNIKVGRQFIKSPLIMSSPAWIMKDSFDSAVFTFNELQNTTLKAMYIQEWNKRYGDTATKASQEDVHFSDPLYSLYVKNKSLKNTTLMGQYVSTNQKGNNGDGPVSVTDGFDMYLTQVDYKLPTSMPFTVSAQYGGATFDATNEEDTNFYGFRVKTKLNNVGLEAAYASISDDNDFPGTIGHIPNASVFNHMMMNTSLYAGLETVSLQAMYDFSNAGIKGLKTRLKATRYKQSDAGMAVSKVDLDGATEINLDIKYAFGGALKGLAVRLIGGYSNHDLDVPSDKGDTDGNENNVKYTRLYIDYKF